LIRRIISRTLQVPLILWAIYTVTFLMVVAAPGNPFQREGGRQLPPAVEESLRRRYGMEDNLSFYFRYLGRVVRGDFGDSLQYDNWSCNEIIAAGLPVSAAIGLAAMLLALVGGLVLGVLGAVRRHGWVDYLSLAVAILGVSVPTFVVGALLLIIFSVTIPILPAGSWQSPIDVLRPALALSLIPMAYITRLTRLGMIEVLRSDYIRTARAKGLSESNVIWRHALRNAVLPVVSYLGPATAMAMTGSFVVERVFNVPGLGIHFVNSVLNRDQMLILSVVLVYSALIIVFNLLIDIAYVLLDPRIESKGAV
jgi:oligopeptide transport system permease protein